MDFTLNRLWSDDVTEYLCSKQTENKFLSAEAIPTPDYVSDEIVIGAVYKSECVGYNFGPITQREFNSEKCWSIITDTRYQARFVSNNRLYCAFVPLEVLTYKITFKKTFEVWKHDRPYGSTDSEIKGKLTVSSQHLVKVLCTSPTNTMPEILYIPYREFIDGYRITRYQEL